MTDMTNAPNHSINHSIASAPAFHSTADDGAHPLPYRDLLAFSAIVSLACLAYHDVLATMARAWLQSSAHLHGAFAAPTAAALIYARRAEWDADDDGGTRAPALFILGASLLVMLAGRAAGIDALRHLAFVGVLIASFVGTFGAARAIRYAAPLGFLFFMPPLGDGVAAPLQQLTANVTASLLALTGIDAVRDGILIFAEGRTFAITQSCSGVRMLTAMMMLTFLLAYIVLNDARRRALVLTAGLVLALLANWLRVFIVITLTVWTDDAFGLAHDHFLIGAVAFALAAATLFALTCKLRAASPHPGRGNSTRPSGRTSTTRMTTVAVLMGMISLTIAYERTVIARAPAPQIASADFTAPPLEAIGWRAASAEIAAWRPDLDHADAVSDHLYTAADGRRLRLAHARFTHDRPEAEIAGYETAHAIAINPGAIRKRRLRTFAFGAPLDLEIMSAKEPESGFALAQVYHLGDQLFASAHDLRIALAVNRLRGRSPDGGVIFVIAHGADTPAAEKAITDFLAVAEPLSRWRERANADAT